MMKKLIIASIFLVPLSSLIAIPGTIVWYPQLLALLFIGLSAIALMFWKMNKWISLILIYEILSYLLVCNQSPRTFLCLMCGFSGVAVAYIISRILDTKVIYKCLVVMAIIQAVYAVLQHFNIDPFFHELQSNKADVVGFIGSHNQLGIYSVSIGIILASLNPFLLLLAVIPIFFARCNSAIIGLLAGLFIYILFTKNKKLLITVSVMILVGLIPWIHYAGKSSIELMERINLWKLTFDQSYSGKLVQIGTKEIDPHLHRQYIANPNFGFGLAKFFEISPLSQSGIFDPEYIKISGITHLYEHAHNDGLEALFELGRIGFILILLAIGSIIIAFVNTYHALWPNVNNLVITFSTLIALSISSLSVYVFHAPVSLFMFFVILGLFYREVEYAKSCKVR